MTHPCLAQLGSSLVVSLLWTSSAESPVNLFLDSGLLDSPSNYDTAFVKTSALTIEILLPVSIVMSQPLPFREPTVN